MKHNFGPKFEKTIKEKGHIDAHEVEEYIKDISNNNIEAFESLYKITKSSVYGFALSLLKNVEDAEDVMHDVYIKIYANAGEYKNEGKPMAWILTITRNLAYSKLRSNKHTENIDDLVDMLGRNDHVTVENKLLLNVVFKEVSDEERNILLLHIVAGLKHREIARFMNIHLSTALSKYHRAIKKLRLGLEEKGE